MVSLKIFNCKKCFYNVPKVFRLQTIKRNGLRPHLPSHVNKILWPFPLVRKHPQQNLWRSKTGAVMQSSFICNSTIRRNITVVHNAMDEERLLNACTTANILPFILSLPLGFNTKLGAESSGISGGQKQRIAIARAVYKNPEFIFLDEATNSLDAGNEKVILENLQDFLMVKR